MLVLNPRLRELFSGVEKIVWRAASQLLVAGPDRRQRGSACLVRHYETSERTTDVGRF